MRDLGRGSDRRVVHHLRDLTTLRRVDERVDFVVAQLAVTGQEPGDPLPADELELSLGVVVAVGCDHVDAGDHVRLGELCRRWNSVRYSSTAWRSAPGAKWEANA